MKTLLLLAVGLCLALKTIIAADSGRDAFNISGKVFDEKNHPVEYATVVLQLKNDSSLVKGEMTDADGIFSIEEISSGDYTLSISFLGYEKYSQEIDLSQSVDLGTIALKKDAATLNEVTVEANKPIIQHYNDKIVLNVENSVMSSSGNALDVLKRAPGVVVDNDGNIRLKGKQGVLVMIDGKPTYLSAEQLANQLRNMQADAISKVEVIQNPGAKYEAEGNAGIINIVTKKNKKQGLNGSLTAGITKNSFWGTNESLSLNDRTKKFNLFGDYDFGRYDRAQHLNIHRKFTYDGVLSNIGDKTDFEFLSYGHNAKAGIDYYLNDKNTIGFQASGFIYPETDYNSTVSTLTDANNNLLSYSTTDGTNDAHYKNISFNFNYDGKFDSAGKELKADADYSYYDNSNRNQYTTTYFDASGNQSGIPYKVYDLNPTTVEITSLKADYTHPVKNVGTFDAGFKTSFVTTNNDFQANTIVDDQVVPDSIRSNHFNYSENINAAYISFSKQWKKFSAQGGLRGEQTIADGNSISTENTFHRNYFQFFPSFSVSDQINDKNSLSLSYSRRIDRPAYQQLDPFVYYINQYLFEQGNPNLQPQLTHSFSLSYMFKQTYNVTFDYSRTIDNIIELFYQIDSTRTTYVTPGNFDKMNYLDVNIYAPFNPTKWWSVTPVLTVYYIDQFTNYLESEYKISKLSFNANLQNSFKLPKGFSAEVNGFYQSGGIWSVATFKSFWQLDAGISKSFLDGKARLKLSVQDIFYTNFIEGTIQYANLDGTINQKNDSRQANLSFTYSFGKQTEQRQHRSGDEEEKSRVKPGQ